MDLKSYHAIGVKGLSEVDMPLFESEFEKALSNNSMIHDPESVRRILRDIWPKETHDDEPAFEIVDTHIEKILLKLGTDDHD